MRSKLAAAAMATLLACTSNAPGPSTEPVPAGTASPAPHPDGRTPLERRRDDACEKVGAKATQCAAEDTKRDFEAGKITKDQYAQDTNEQVIRKNTEVYVEKCKKAEMSSRQVRVMEVCMKEETACGPWQACIANMQPQAR